MCVYKNSSEVRTEESKVHTKNKGSTTLGTGGCVNCIVSKRVKCHVNLYKSLRSWYICKGVKKKEFVFNCMLFARNMKRKKVICYIGRLGGVQLNIK